MKIKIISLFCLLNISAIYSIGQNKNTDTLAQTKPKPFLLPNSEILITPPAHFKYSEKINGFIHPGTFSSITVTYIDGTSFLQITEGLTSEYFTSQNTVLVSGEDVKTKSGMDGKLYLLSFSVTSTDTSKKVMQFERMMLFTGDYQRTIWINASYPVLVKKLLYQVIKESLLSVEFTSKNE